MDTVTMSAAGESAVMEREAFDQAVSIISAAHIPGDEMFGGDFREAPDLERIVARLIAGKEQFAFLSEYQQEICILWKRKGGQSGQKVTLGKCQKLSGAARHFSGRSYLIWCAADHCRRAGLSRQQIEALVFHELCHLAPGELDDVTGVQAPPVIVGHDFEGFLSELSEYGLWRPDLQEARNAFDQLPLFG